MYFAGVMVRLMLTLTPVVCILAAIGFSRTLDRYLNDQEEEPPKEPKSKVPETDAKKKKKESKKEVNCQCAGST